MGIEESCPRPLRPRPPPQQPIRHSRPGGVSRPKPRPGPGGGVSGAVTSPRDPAGDVRGAARVVGARLARAGVGGARPGPRTLRPHDRGDGGAEAAARAPPGAASPGALALQTRRRSAASGAQGLEGTREGGSQASPVPGQ